MNLYSIHRKFFDLVDTGVPYQTCRNKVGYTLFWRVSDEFLHESLYEIPATIASALRVQP